jgi:hypothetical protein
MNLPISFSLVLAGYVEKWVDHADQCQFLGRAPGNLRCFSKDSGSVYPVGNGWKASHSLSLMSTATKTEKQSRESVLTRGLPGGHFGWQEYQWPDCSAVERAELTRCSP